jgi:chemotaxis protein methyltransferase CheR
MFVDLTTVELSDDQFSRISKLVYRLCGINLRSGKEELVKARLTKRLRLLEMGSFDDYLRYVEADQSGQELTYMVDALTTNKTSFFREMEHFEFLQTQILPAIKDNGRRARFWSAGCSSGEEPYSLAMLLREELRDIDDRDIRILATDISNTVLNKARQAVYTQEVLSGMPALLLQRYFTCCNSKLPRMYRAKDSIRNMVTFAKLNLMGNWPMKGPFNTIFCRNVMIYFDKPTQEYLVNCFWELLGENGYLFVGHSESLACVSHQFSYVQPAVYVKHSGK